MEQKIYTSCTLDCPDGCGIIAHVKVRQVFGNVAGNQTIEGAMQL